MAFFIRTLALGLAWLTFIPGSLAGCHDPTPAFPLPELDKEDVVLKEAFATITTNLKAIVSKPEYDTSSFSVEVTTSEETLWTLYHTAVDRDADRPGTKQVNGDSVYRIASISKAFTTLAIIQQHIKGNINIDDTVDKYISELQQSQEGGIPWKDITLRTLASQLSGIPREFAQSDMINELADPTAFGLPFIARDNLLSCDEYSHYDTPCTQKDLLDNLRQRSPLFAPKQKSTYSNVNYEILGLVLENATGVDYPTYLQKSILEPLGMTSSSIAKPNDHVAVLPKGDNYWDVDEGVQNPTGGIYSSSTDLTKFIRYVLTHYNGLSPQFNWFNPQSFSTSAYSFYGMPWEMYRTDKILDHTRRPVTFVTKSGGLPGYYSIIAMVPDYDLGYTILTSGNASLKSDIQEALAPALVNAAETIAQAGLRTKYAATYSTSPKTGLNSSITFSQSASRGLHVERFVSNGTDIFQAFSTYLGARTEDDPYRLQLVPTLLFKDELNKKGEIFRMVVVPEKRDPKAYFDEFCITDEDPYMYAGKPLMEAVFWDGDDGHYKEVEMTGFRVKLQRNTTASGETIPKKSKAGIWGAKQQTVLDL